MPCSRMLSLVLASSCRSTTSKLSARSIRRAFPGPVHPQGDGRDGQQTVTLRVQPTGLHVHHDPAGFVHRRAVGTTGFAGDRASSWPTSGSQVAGAVATGAPRETSRAGSAGRYRSGWRRAMRFGASGRAWSSSWTRRRSICRNSKPPTQASYSVSASFSNGPTACSRLRVLVSKMPCARRNGGLRRQRWLHLAASGRRCPRHPCRWRRASSGARCGSARSTPSA